MKRKELSANSRLSRREVMVSTWRGLHKTSIGADDLKTIQRVIVERFGEEDVESPARIAAELVKEGAELRHPEVIEYDARWRESLIANQMKPFERVTSLRKSGPLTFDEGRTSITELEQLRVHFVDLDDDIGVNNLRELAIEARDDTMKKAGDNSLPLAIREVQTEVAEWLRVWLETPHLFAHWLELRQASTEFRTKFAVD